MNTKFTPIFILLVIASFTTTAQTNVLTKNKNSETEQPKNVNSKNTIAGRDGFAAILQGIIAEDEKYVSPDTKNLVSAYTYSNLVRNDFLTLLGIGNATSVTPYAALQVQPGNTQLSFSPFVTYRNDLTDRPFANITSLTITGSVDPTMNLFNFQNWRTLSASVSWTHLINKWSGYRHYKISTGDTKNAKPGELTYQQYHDLYDELCQKFMAEYDDPNTVMVKLNHPEFFDSEKLAKAFRDSVSKYEQLLTADHWTIKQYHWIKLTGNAAFDNPNYIVLGDTSTYDNPKTKGIPTPSINASYNYFLGFKGGWNLYASIYTQIGLKDEFSEVYTANTYNSFHPLSDTSFIQKTNEQVFETYTDNMGTRVLPNFGGELVAILPNTKIGSYGVDILYSHDDIISNKRYSLNGYLATIMVGVPISLIDKTGLPTVNFEPYFQYKSFFNETIPNAHLWGAKFTVPISRVF
jgi:hypothetical protein